MAPNPKFEPFSLTAARFEKIVQCIFLCRDTFHMSVPGARHVRRNQTRRHAACESETAVTFKLILSALYNSPSLPLAHKQAKVHAGTACVPTSKMFNQMLSSAPVVNTHPAELLPAPAVPHWSWNCTFTSHRGETIISPQESIIYIILLILQFQKAFPAILHVISKSASWSLNCKFWKKKERSPYRLTLIHI